MSTERRRFFRISDTIGLSFRVVTPELPDLSLTSDSIDEFEIIEKLDFELEKLLDTLWSSDPTYAKAIGLLNQKIDLMFGGSNSANRNRKLFDHSFTNLEVNLSASGIAFTTDVEVEVHDRLELQLLLSPSTPALVIKGTIVNVDEKEFDGEKAYFTCVDFDIEVRKRERLIQHIVQRQVEYIVKKREAS